MTFNMTRQFPLALLRPLLRPLLLSLLLPLQAQADLPERTPIDDYVGKPDSSYQWKVIKSSTVDGVTSVVVDFISQTWRTDEEVDRPQWQHWLTLAIPDKASTTDVGLLFVGGGSNGREPPGQANERSISMAKATGSIVAELRMVPNQPLIFHGDGIKRTEDDLIGYTWEQYMDSGDPTWLARNPMVKSAVRAMDTMTSVAALPRFGKLDLKRFVVAGGSKRGWTTWLTGAMDARVIGIIPIVIDVVNADPSMRQHFAAYGFWAPSVGNYVDHNIMARLDHPRLQDAYDLVDPYHYRHRLTMPKLILNAAGDQFFLPDSSKFYWDELRGENYLRYVANGDHGLDDTDALDSVIAFFSLIREGRKPPQFSWTRAADGELLVMTQRRPVDQPQKALLWQATNPRARDFRVETLGRAYTSTPLQPGEDGLYRVNVAPPTTGWTAYFVELQFDVGATVPLKLTTDVTVTPNELPFADKRADLPASVTLICTAADAGHAARLLEAVSDAVRDADFIADELRSHIDGSRLYLNWTPTESIYKGPLDVQAFLANLECENFNYQLESGPRMTLPPVGTTMNQTP